MGADRVALALVALAFVAPAGARASEAGRLVVGPMATVAGKMVRLADVALLEGGARAFADLDLGPAPDPGASRRIDGVSILRRLGEAGFDARTLRYEIPAVVRVERASQEVRVEQIRAAIESVAPAALAPGESIRSLDVAGPIRIPAGAYETRVSTPAPSGQGSRRRFDVEIVQDGVVVGRASVRADVSAFGPVVTIRQPVARGAVLQADDVAVVERDVGAAPAGVMGDPRDAIGKEARVALAPGTVLAASALASPIVVHRGDLVTAVVERAGMRVTAPAEALEGGAAGAAIRLVNRSSRQELSATVVGRGVVRVDY